MMELRDLRYFLAAVECGSLTAAALRLHAGQPTLSHAVARLERELGEGLLERPANRRSGVRPTAAGRRLAERSRRALAEVDAVRADIADLHGLLAGELTIGSIQSLNHTLLPGALARFARRHAQVALRLRTHAGEDLPRELRAGRCDLAVVAGIPAADLAGCRRRLLVREEFVAIVRRDDPLARLARVPLARLKGRPWLERAARHLDQAAAR